MPPSCLAVIMANSRPKTLQKRYCLLSWSSFMSIRKVSTVSSVVGTLLVRRANSINGIENRLDRIVIGKAAAGHSPELAVVVLELA